MYHQCGLCSLRVSIAEKMSSDRRKRLLWQNTLTFEMQPDIASGIGITMKNRLCIESSWVIGDKTHILLAQTIKYILFWMANSFSMVSKSVWRPWCNS